VKKWFGQNKVMRSDRDKGEKIARLLRYVKRSEVGSLKSMGGWLVRFNLVAPLFHSGKWCKLIKSNDRQERSVRMVLKHVSS
jgi:hypothetical protein